VPADGVLHRSGLGLAKDLDDLLGRESALAHRSSSPFKATGGLNFTLRGFAGAGQPL